MLVLKDAFPDSEILKDTNLTRKKIPTIITDIIHPQIKLNLYEKMKDSIFTLILDESTDNSNILQLTIVINILIKRLIHQILHFSHQRITRIKC